MIPAVSRRKPLLGASAVVAVAGIPSLDAVALPPALPDIETKLGPKALAAARDFCATRVNSLRPPFDDHGRFAISASFRAGLTRFLAGEDNIVIRREQEALYPSLDVSCARWMASPDYYVLYILRAPLWREVRLAFGQSAWPVCDTPYGELRDEPGIPALLLTRCTCGTRRDLPHIPT